MAKRGKGRKGGKPRKKAAATATVRLRFANEGKMAKRKSGKRKGSTKRRKNPGHHRGKRRTHHRRRNPSTFMGAMGHLLGAGAVALGTGALVLMAQAKWAQPKPDAQGNLQPNNLALYGIPAAALVAAALVAKKAPTIAVGMGTGALAGPFALPLFSKVSAQTSGGGTAAATHAALSAVELGQLGWVSERQRMASVHMDAYG